ncbi:MAG TPA: hypothetical protein VNG33_12295 [Polyangiaceae bacterium]|nr:hypothetical protein [Polyangiaceae bacterium]
MSRRRRTLAVLGVALGLSGVARSAAAQEPAVTESKRLAAQDAHRHALELFDQGRHVEALAEFKRAYGLSPSFRILYNIGLSQAALGDAPAAIDAFSGYLREGGERVVPERRQQVEAEIARLSKLLGWLSIDVDEAGAELTLDGTLLGKGPLSQRLRLGTGQHTASVRSPDGTLKTQSVRLAAGDEQRLRFQALPSTAADSSLATSPRGRPSDAAPKSEREVPWALWGVTGVLGAASGVTGILALSAHADEQDARVRRGVTHEELQAARDKVASRALATDILLAGTVLAAGVSTYLTLRPSHPESGQTSLLVLPGALLLRRSF